MKTRNWLRIRFPQTADDKFLLICAMFAVAVTITALITGLWHTGLYYLGLTILFFPTGLTHAFIDPLINMIWPVSGNVPSRQIDFISAWLIYLAITVPIIIVKNQRVSRILFFVLAMLLITNVAGCSRLVANQFSR